MTKPLAPEVVPPPSTRSLYGAAVVGACGILGLAIATADAPAPAALVVALPAPAPVLAPPAPPAPILADEDPAPRAVDPRAGELKLAVQAGGRTYVKLATVAGGDRDGDGAPGEGMALPRHGRASLVGGTEGDWTYSAIAPVRAEDLGAEHRAWAARDVIVGGNCRARVRGFAVMARLTGDTAYAGVDAAGPSSDGWTAKTALATGARMLVAELDTACKGRVARDAALAPIVLPWMQQDAALAAMARAKLVASELGKRETAEWQELGQGGTWHDSRELDLATSVVRHPTTHETFVSIHASMPWGCGGPDINNWALYRVVDRDGTRTLETVVERELTMRTIDQIVDIENDGTFELIGEPLFDEAIIERADGTIVDQLERPFFGCPC